MSCLHHTFRCQTASVLDSILTITFHMKWWTIPLVIERQLWLCGKTKDMTTQVQLALFHWWRQERHLAINAPMLYKKSQSACGHIQALEQGECMILKGHLFLANIKFTLHRADSFIPSWLRTDVEFCVNCCGCSCCWCGFDTQGATAAVPLLDITDDVDDRFERLVWGAIGRTVGPLDTGLWGATPTPPGTTTQSVELCNNVMLAIHNALYGCHLSIRNSLSMISLSCTVW